MKKTDVLKTLTRSVRSDVKPLVRKQAYIIAWHCHSMIIQITHFHKGGIVFKPLSVAPGFQEANRTGTIRYDQIHQHNFRPATIHDITCNMGTGTRFMSDYYGDTKNLLAKHGTEL